VPQRPLRSLVRFCPPLHFYAELRSYRCSNANRSAYAASQLRLRRIIGIRAGLLAIYRQKPRQLNCIGDAIRRQIRCECRTAGASSPATTRVVAVKGRVVACDVAQFGRSALASDMPPLRDTARRPGFAKAGSAFARRRPERPPLAPLRSSPFPATEVSVNPPETVQRPHRRAQRRCSGSARRSRPRREHSLRL
jgi:hypothetical protein